MQDRQSTSDQDHGSIRRGAGGRFLPGQSANRGGRPKVVREVHEIARQYAALAIRTLVEIAGDARKPAAARNFAAVALLDRGFGRPHQSIAVATPPAHAPQPGGTPDPAACYLYMMNGTMPLDPDHPAFRSRQDVIEVPAAPPETMPGSTSTEAAPADASEASTAPAPPYAAAAADKLKS